jgi:hypothetical protein
MINLTSLKEINLAENNFTYIPLLLFNLRGLKIANLNYNKITDFNISDDGNNATIISCECNLKILYLVKNEIKNLPYDLIMSDFFMNIEHLALDDNPITKPKKILINKIKKFYLEKITYQLVDNVDDKENENNENNLVGNIKNEENENSIFLCYLIFLNKYIDKLIKIWIFIYYDN